MGGITPAELAAIGDRLAAFADDVFASLPRTDQRAGGQCYLRGLPLVWRGQSGPHDQVLHGDGAACARPAACGGGCHRRR